MCLAFALKLCGTLLAVTLLRSTSSSFLGVRLKHCLYFFVLVALAWLARQNGEYVTMLRIDLIGKGQNVQGALCAGVGALVFLCWFAGCLATIYGAVFRSDRYYKKKARH